MAQTTTNYGLLKPESTDSYNHLIYDNPNMDTIDATMKANSDASVVSATCIKSGTTHTITRSNTDANVFKFTATGDWNSGDTMIIDGVTVSPFLMTGEALKTGAYLINSEVIIALSGTRATVLSNQSEAGTTYFDDTNVSITATNVQTALDLISDKVDATSSHFIFDAIPLNSSRTLPATDVGLIVCVRAGFGLYAVCDRSVSPLVDDPTHFTVTFNNDNTVTVDNIGNSRANIMYIYQ